jgi:ABC-2 type transport system permease protein
VTSAARAERPNGLGKLAAPVTFAGAAWAIADAEARKLARDPTELISRAVQPALWLIVFGEVFTRLHAIPTGSLSYIAFMTPGVLAQSVLFSSIFYGIAVIWERDLGIVHKLLVSPAPRAALVTRTTPSTGTALSRATPRVVSGSVRRTIASWRRSPITTS